MMLEANDSLADFGCLQTEEIIKWSIMDNYKTHKGIVTEKLRAAVGKLYIFRILKEQYEDIQYKRTTHYLPVQARVSLGSLR
jgi:hypothetical protein